ncbi:MAG: putative toxin-antitoxin system toxin component, PIN family [Thaumarchaeota archaeon]|nr:putative toxin-antitoxin system toxin component, PIN family [Nitrososphaerota archaeon]
MRITFDTNVLVSAFISRRGQPAAILDIVLTFPEMEMVLSEPILDEFRDVLSRQEVKERFEYSAGDIEQFVDAIRDASTIVKPSSILKLVVEDPKDDVIINTAYDGKSNYIVSGDHHLFELEVFRGIRIVTPRTMLEIIRRRFGELLMPGET